MKSVLLLGRGYIGRGLEEYLRLRNVQVDCLSRGMLDYTKPTALQPYLHENKNKYDVVINCSGYTGTPNVDGCELNKEDCWFWNVIVPRNIVLCANFFEIPLIQVNSGCIYNGYDKEYAEEDTPNFGLFSNESSFYSKTKHACESIFQNCHAYSLRIRMPFEGESNKKNYLKKLLNYNTLISQKNSLTSVYDFYGFILKLLYVLNTIPAGPINVVNSGSIDAKEIVEMLRKKGINNPDWTFIEPNELNTPARRSNCVLSTAKIHTLGIQLPPVHESLERDISKLAISI